MRKKWTGSPVAEESARRSGENDVCRCDENGGTYKKVAGKGRRVRAQQKFYRAAAHAMPQFRPLTRPKPEE